jgi:hypothetical protein
MSTLKSLVSDGKLVHFQFYRKGELWYKTDDGFEFAVPVSDTGDGTFLASDRAMLFMRYIRKQLEANALGATNAESESQNAISV